MKAVVTGGCGFIGSHLVELLLEQGLNVLVIDNLFSGSTSNLPLDKQKLEFLEADIRDAETISNAFEGADWVFHLAGMADIVPSIENPNEYFSTNVTGTLNVLSASKFAGVKKIVYAASSSSYGIAEQYPTAETAPIRPQYPYALTKFMGEELVMHWNLVYGLDAISLRLFNVFGPRSRTSGAYGAVFGVFLAQKLKGMPFTVVGDGEQTRDFTFVTDVANAFLQAAQSSRSGQIYNVGSGGHYSVNKLVSLLGGDVVYIPKRPGEPDCTFADITKITEELGWSPSIRFEEGVRIMLDNIGAWESAPVWDPKSIDNATKTWFEFLK